MSNIFPSCLKDKENVTQERTIILQHGLLAAIPQGLPAHVPSHSSHPRASNTDVTDETGIPPGSSSLGLCSQLQELLVATASQLSPSLETCPQLTGAGLPWRLPLSGWSTVSRLTYVGAQKSGFLALRGTTLWHGLSLEVPCGLPLG